MSDISRAGEVIGSASGSPHWLASTLFAAGLGSGIYFTSSKALDEINSVLVGLVVATFAVSFFLIPEKVICHCPPLGMLLVIINFMNVSDFIVFLTSLCLLVGYVILLGWMLCCCSMDA